MLILASILGEKDLVRIIQPQSMKLLYFGTLLWSRLKGYRWKQGRYLDLYQESFRLRNAVFLHDGLISKAHPIPLAVPDALAICCVIYKGKKAVGTVCLFDPDIEVPVYFDTYPDLEAQLPDLQLYFDVAGLGVLPAYRDAAQTVFLGLILMAYRFSRRKGRSHWLFSTDRGMFTYLRRYNPGTSILSKRGARPAEGTPRAAYHSHFTDSFFATIRCYEFPLAEASVRKAIRESRKRMRKIRRKK